MPCRHAAALKIADAHANIQIHAAVSRQRPRQRYASLPRYGFLLFDCQLLSR